MLLVCRLVIFIFIAVFHDIHIVIINVTTMMLKKECLFYFKYTFIFRLIIIYLLFPHKMVMIFYYNGNSAFILHSHSIKYVICWSLIMYYAKENKMYSQVYSRDNLNWQIIKALNLNFVHWTKSI